jgi:N-acetylglucosamine kinase-like BadF-type ATPase
VTAYAGALGQSPGGVVAAGTGLIALGTDLDTRRRADGWGHLLGDCGGGAWIGRAGLEAALRAHDGRAGGSRPLLERMEAVFREGIIADFTLTENLVLGLDRSASWVRRGIIHQSEA